jgi:hypothetical protein
MNMYRIIFAELRIRIRYFFWPLGPNKDKFFSGSRIPDPQPIVQRTWQQFLPVKTKTYICSKINNLQFFEIYGYKKRSDDKFSPSTFVVVVVGSGILDPGSEMEKIRIRDIRNIGS